MRHFVRPVALMLTIGSALVIGPAKAAPPTVTPSPGYDQRLQESRRPSVAPSWQGRQPARRAPKHKRRH